MTRRLAYAALALILPTCAWAQATPPTTQVWFGDALQAVLVACAAPVSAILCAMLWKLAAKFGVEASAADQAKLTSEATTALTQAAVAAGPLIAEKGWDHVDVHNAVLAGALNFFLQRYPDRSTAIAAAAGVAAPSLPSAAKNDAVTQTLMARLPDAMTAAAASPATPAAPVAAVVVSAPPTA